LKFRAFVSADIEPGESLTALLRELAASKADLKIVSPDHLHITLKFLGDTEDSLVGQIEEGMQASVTGIPPFAIRLEGMGAFPSISNIRVVWVGMKDCDGLGTIASRLEKSMEELGFVPENKEFVPHLTLARTRSGRNIANVQEIIRERAANDYGTYPIDRIRLKKSVLSPRGPTYSVVREVRLDSSG
jgi:2'-5' RNA ligase